MTAEKKGVQKKKWTPELSRIVEPSWPFGENGEVVTVTKDGLTVTWEDGVVYLPEIDVSKTGGRIF